MNKTQYEILKYGILATYQLLLGGLLVSAFIFDKYVIAQVSFFSYILIGLGLLMVVFALINYMRFAFTDEEKK